MKHRIACLLLAVGMLLTGVAFAAGTDAPPPHAPPPVTEAPAENDAPLPPPQNDPPPASEGEYNPIIGLFLDANGGTFRNNLGMNLYEAEMPFTPGNTLASTGYTIDAITRKGKTFQGWIAYNETTGQAISGLLTTAEVLNYTIPNHPIRFQIQWTAQAAPTPSPAPTAAPAPSAGSPAGIHTLSTRQLQSGDTYKASMTAMKKATQSDNVLIFDITATDAAGQDLHQLTETTEVTIPLPQTYVIQPGNTALVYYLPGDGTAVPCPTELHEEDPANRHVVFRTDHFSLYAVAEVAKAPDAPAPAPGASDTLTYPTGPDNPATAVPDGPPAQSSSAPAEPETSAAPEPSAGKPPVSAPAAPEAPIPTTGAEQNRFPAAVLLIPAVVVIAGVLFFLKKR